MKHILFVSNNPRKPSHIEPAIKKGYTISLIKNHPEPKDYDMFDHVLDTDLFDLNDVLEKVKSIHSKQKIDGVLTRFEPYIPLVGVICDTLMIPGPSLQSCISCRNKLSMRQKLQSFAVDQPNFYDFKSTIPKKAYPLLVKPTKGAKSRYIMKANDPEEMLKVVKYIQYLMENSGHTLFRPINGIEKRENDIIAEEILTGKQVTTTSFVVDKRVHHIDLADVITSHDAGMEGFHLLSRTTPSTLSDREKRLVTNMATKAIEALEINNSFLHPEIMLTEDGPKILEVAARVGGYRPEMTKLAFGIDLNEIAIEVSLGNTPKTKKKHDKAATAVEVWPVKSGRLKGFKRMDDVLSIRGVKSFKLKRVPGNIFHADSIGTKPLATFYTVADTPEKSKKIADQVLNTLEPIID